MANLVNGFLTIYLDKTSELNKSAVDEIINNLKNNGLFTYGGDCDITFNEEEREFEVGFSCGGSCESCWDWIDNEISDGKDNKKLSSEARTLLLNSRISGSSDYASVSKENGDKQLDRCDESEIFEL